MTQCSCTVAPVPPDAIEPDWLAAPLVLDDPSAVLELIAEVDAIFCPDENTARCRRSSPAVLGCALDGSRCSGRSWREFAPGRGQGLKRRANPRQRSPPSSRHMSTPEI